MLLAVGLARPSAGLTVRISLTAVASFVTEGLLGHWGVVACSQGLSQLAGRGYLVPGCTQWSLFLKSASVLEIRESLLLNQFALVFLQGCPLVLFAPSNCRLPILLEFFWGW